MSEVGLAFCVGAAVAIIVRAVADGVAEHRRWRKWARENLTVIGKKK